MESIYYRRNLPHYLPPIATYFITFRLAESLPTNVIITLKEEYITFEQQLHKIRDPVEKETKLRNHRKRYFARFDEFIDKHSYGPTWLRDKRVAQIVADAIHHRNGKNYELITYCIMPNHVHMVCNVERSDTSLYRILQSLKSYTARECNRILGRSGPFWQHESYDHVVRNGKELERIISYVLLNPVSARLTNDWHKWRWSYWKDKTGRETLDSW